MIGIIGGSGMETLIKEGKEERVATPYGASETLVKGRVGRLAVVFLARHGRSHNVPPHRINYRANIWSLKQAGVNRIIATNAVGALNEKMRPGGISIPHDIIDFTKARSHTFYDGGPVTHVDVTHPYCPEVRQSLTKACKNAKVKFSDRAVMVCTEGPRYETPAEIRFYRSAGCDIVGMTGAPEAFLARELEICYASLCFISNMAAGISGRLSAKEVQQMGSEISGLLGNILRDSIPLIPRKRSCECATSLRLARVN